MTESRLWSQTCLVSCLLLRTWMTWALDISFFSDNVVMTMSCVKHLKYWQALESCSSSNTAGNLTQAFFDHQLCEQCQYPLCSHKILILGTDSESSCSLELGYTAGERKYVITKSHMWFKLVYLQFINFLHCKYIKI